MKHYQAKLGDDPESESYLLNYALKKQFNLKVKNGISVDILNKNILEIGCGHGGISVFMALNGAKNVVGIDLSQRDLAIAKKFAKQTASKLDKDLTLPVKFMEMNAYDMTFEHNSFDIVFADNVFEHFMEPQKVLEQCYKILKPNGLVVVPVFSSIWSKYALHLKNGLKVPWANLVFSEQTICNVMVRLSKEDPNISKRYPGVNENPKKVRDLRRYKDLNDITYGKFKRMAANTGFDIINFKSRPTPYLFGKILNKIPLLKKSILVDVCSLNASAVLIKRK